MLVLAAVNLVLGLVPRPWWWGGIVAFASSGLSIYLSEKVDVWRTEARLAQMQINDILLNMIVSFVVVFAAYFVGYGLRKIMDRKQKH
ncbi:hypothetical protein [Martelella mangrovi]|uniref:Membrane protein implicated in regulation of membrane protease activity n=1 Tax=Martelella mangrovi TaxID=1397477 RepID=A0ABV2IDS4_9HYPH